MRNLKWCPVRPGSLVRLFCLPAVVVACLLLVPQFGHTEPLTLSGFTEPALDAKLGLAVTGRVVKLNVREGQAVKKGEALLELDQHLEQLEVKRRELLWRNRSEVDAAKRQLDTLSRHLDETRSLYKATGSVPREEMERQEMEVDVARIDLRRLEIAEEREELEYNIAREDLRKRTLVAPFAGQVAAVLIEIGENCEPDTPLVHLVGTSPVNFVANVELGVSRKLKVGQKVDVALHTGTESVNREGKIVFISPVIDPASGLRTVKARFDNQDGKVIPGVTGDMRVNAE